MAPGINTGQSHQHVKHLTLLRVEYGIDGHSFCIHSHRANNADDDDDDEDGGTASRRGGGRQVE